MLEIQIEVERRENVFQRGRALRFHDNVRGVEIKISASAFIYAFDGAGDFIRLCRGHTICPDVDNPELRIFHSQCIQINRAIGGEDIVALIPRDHLRRIRAVSDKIIDDLIPG